jgi:hypothetical protein
MIRRRDTTDLQGSTQALRAARVVACLGAAVCAVFLAFSAPAQEAPKLDSNPAQNPAPTPAPSPAPGAPVAEPPVTQPSNPSYQPGFIDALGRWLEEGKSKLKSDMQGARESFDKFGDRAREAAKDATGTVIGLPNTRVVAGHERCIVAANGAPDCQAAANTFCRGKGFQSGKSVDTQSEQKCSARLLLEGRAPNNSECATEIFVTRAVCQ